MFNRFAISVAPSPSKPLIDAKLRVDVIAAMIRA
jgi:hypothetical protein